MIREYYFRKVFVQTTKYVSLDNIALYSDNGSLDSHPQSENAHHSSCVAGSFDNYRKILCQPVRSSFACVHILLWACSCVCTLPLSSVCTFTRVHHVQLRVCCLYSGLYMFMLACVYVHWCLLHVRVVTQLVSHFPAVYEAAKPQVDHGK